MFSIAKVPTNIDELGTLQITGALAHGVAKHPEVIDVFSHRNGDAKNCH